MQILAQVTFNWHWWEINNMVLTQAMLLCIQNNPACEVLVSWLAIVQTQLKKKKKIPAELHSWYTRHVLWKTLQVMRIVASCSKRSRNWTWMSIPNPKLQCCGVWKKFKGSVVREPVPYSKSCTERNLTNLKKKKILSGKENFKKIFMGGKVVF